MRRSLSLSNRNTMIPTVTKITLALIILLAVSVCFTYAQRSRPDFCNLPPEKGRCRAKMPRYSYNPSTGKCEKFIYGGCKGNRNRFEEIKDCEEACGVNN